MRHNVNDVNRLFGNAADKVSKEAPGTTFYAVDTKEIFVYNESGDPVLVGIGTAAPTAPTLVAVPASAGAAGVVGDIAFESGFAYFCIAANTWERVVIATWP